MAHQNLRRFLAISGIIIILLLLWHLFSPYGLVRYFQLQNELAEIRTQNEQLTRHNEELTAELNRFKKDDAFFTEIARKQHGMIKKNEIIFDFSPKR
jgi:cell division protein FtsB